MASAHFPDILRNHEPLVELTQDLEEGTITMPLSTAQVVLEQGSGWTLLSKLRNEPRLSIGSSSVIKPDLVDEQYESGIEVSIPNPARLFYELGKRGFLGPTRPSLSGLRKGIIAGLL